MHQQINIDLNAITNVNMSTVTIIDLESDPNRLATDDGDEEVIGERRMGLLRPQFYLVECSMLIYSVHSR